MTTAKTGIIINNIGTPDEYSPKAVGRYLGEFLMDKEILTLPFFIRWPLVHIGIVPRRRFQSAKKYKKIWGAKKSPLLEITEAFNEKLQKELGADYSVKCGMRYGNPSIEKAILELKAEGVEKIIFIPMYPQNATATTRSANNKFLEKMALAPGIKTKMIAPFFREKSYIENSARLLQTEMNKKKYDHVMFSFHGLPEDQLRKDPNCQIENSCCFSDQQISAGCYRAHSFASVKKIADLVGLSESNYTVTFQSRVGPKKWIEPYTSATAEALAKKGIKNILVQTPSFTVDCLETLEEIKLELKEEFIHAGGETLDQVPCLNDDPKWVADFSKFILKNI